MGRMTAGSLFDLIHGFFMTYLPGQKCASPHTAVAYRQAINLYLGFICESTGTALKNLDFSAFQKQHAEGFLAWMKDTKQYAPATINQKMAGIREFLSYASARNPELVVYLRGFSDIPRQKTDTWASIDYMSENAVNAILRQPDPNTRSGLRDLFYMVMIYDTAARVDEMAKIRICDVRIGKTSTVMLQGKGSKTRTVPLMERTVSYFRQYVILFHPHETEYSKQPLFYVERKGTVTPMSDDNVRRFMKKYASLARSECTEVPDSVYPHLWRHSRAMHLYQHGMDLTLISQWLGHANLEVTLVYAHADTEKKREAINKAMENTSLATPDASVFMVDDDELLKKLCGLR